MEFIGIDFGTSNSLASRLENQQIEFVRFADHGISNPTIIYFPAKSRLVEIGTGAIENYLDDIDEHEPVGRLMLSIKSLLPDAKFDHTIVMGHGKQTAAGLAARFLKEIKHLAEKQFERQFDGVVLGRPVDFSDLAIARLEEAARAAGFREVVFWLEPAAAAMDFERRSTADELVCVVDIGGGTSDFCIIETSPARVAEPDRIRDIKAVSGVNLAGDAFSSEIMRHRLAERFGEGSTYKSLGKTLPFPVHILNTLNRWHRIHQLNDGQTLPALAEIRVSSDRPDDVDRVIKLIDHNYGYQLFRAIDQAKRELTSQDSSQIKFSPLGIDQKIEVTDFDDLIRPIVTKIEEAVFNCLRLATVTPGQIGRVLLTGGSSQVPLIDRTVRRIFGPEKITRPDFFSSIATGLGYVAGRLE